MELFLHILSVAGSVLLIILLIIAVLLALILFLPVVYKIKLKKVDKFNASGNVRWLFGAVWFSFLFNEAGFSWNLRIFGFPLGKKRQPGKAAQEAKDEEYAPAKKQPTIKPGERVGEYKEDRTGSAAGGEGRSANDAYDGGRLRRIKDNEAFEEKAAPSLAEKIRFTFRNICDKLKKAGEFIELFKKIKPVLKKLLKAVMPRKISGYIDFGLEDPADTGMVLAVLGALCIPIPEKLKVTPYFNEKKFECDVKISGRIFIIILLINAVRLFKVPEVRKLLKDALPKKNGGKRRK